MKARKNDLIKPENVHVGIWMDRYFRNNSGIDQITKSNSSACK